MIKNICIATDDSYLIGAKVLLASIAKSTSDPVRSQLRINLAYLPSKLSENNIEKINHICLKLGLHLALHPFESQITDEDIFQGGQARKHITSTTLAKFYFFDSMSEPFLWLDTDIAVREGWEQLLEYGSHFSQRLPYLVVGDNPHHFNAGVMGCLGGAPIEDWKSEVGKHEMSVEEHIFVEAMKNASVRCPQVYNSISRWGSDAKTKEGLVIHYGGPIKPWHFRSSLWSSCKSNACGWHTWYEAAEYLAEFDKDIYVFIERNLVPAKPHNNSSKVSAFLAFINLKLVSALIPGLKFAKKTASAQRDSMTHPLCVSES